MLMYPECSISFCIHNMYVYSYIDINKLILDTESMPSSPSPMVKE